MNVNSPIKFEPGRDGYSSDEGSTVKRPSGTPKRDFQRVLGDSERDPKGGRSSKKTDLEDQEEAQDLEELALLDSKRLSGSRPQPNPSASVFDLSKEGGQPIQPAIGQTSQQSSTQPIGAADDRQSPASLFAKLSKNTGKPFPTDAKEAAQAMPSQMQKKTAAQTVNPKAQTPIDAGVPPIAAAPEGKIEKKDNFVFTTEQPDLSYINTMASAPKPIEVPIVQIETPVPQTTSTAELVSQLIKEMSVMQVNGTTETTLLLKNPPVFDGARVTLTSFDNAKGEFNIRFDNLTQQAQQIIQIEQQSLLASLQQKGYNVHILTATTFEENNLFTANVDQPSRERGSQQESGGFADDEQEERGRQG